MSEVSELYAVPLTPTLQTLSFSVQGKGTIADLDPVCIEPRIGPCPLVQGPKETGVDLKYLRVYWMVGLSARRIVSATGRGPLPCLSQQNG